MSTNRRVYLFASIILSATCALAADPPVAKSAAEKQKVYEDSMRQISLRTANLFQEKFVDRCLDRLPDGVELKYIGYLSVYTVPGSKLIGAAANTSNLWHVEKNGGPVVFRFWLSTKPTDETIQAVKIEDQQLYVNVDFVDKNKGVDAELPQLGNRSVREVLKLLEDSPEKKDVPKQPTKNPAKSSKK